MRYPINDEWYFTEHYRGSLNSMPSERLEELEKIRVPHTVKHLPARYLDEKEYQMISGYVKELNIPAEWSGNRLSWLWKEPHIRQSCTAMGRV